MAWKLAPALDVLRRQVNEAAPKRSKVADGTIGDTAHSARKSDHNPDAQDVVRAIDLTHDPANGADMAAIAEKLRASRDRRIKYCIFQGRYFSPKTAWQWRPYTGPNAHEKHLHLSVTANDSTTKWPINDGEEEDMPFTPEEAATLKALAPYGSTLTDLGKGLVSPGPTTGRRGNGQSLIHVLETHRIFADNAGVSAMDHVELARLLGQ